MTHLEHQLANGLRIVFQETDAPVGHCALMIDTGSRDELPEEHGMAHFIEHNLFKGTKKRKAYHVLSRLDVVGGELNAYTTKEDTTIHTSFLAVHFGRAIELMADILLNSTFPEKEIKKEKDVILDEIYAYLDSPGESIFDDFEDRSFLRQNGFGRFYSAFGKWPTSVQKWRNAIRHFRTSACRNCAKRHWRFAHKLPKLQPLNQRCTAAQLATSGAQSIQAKACTTKYWRQCRCQFRYCFE